MNTDTVKQIYTALNRGDIATAVKDFALDVVRVEFEGTPHAGAFHGLAEVTAHFAKGRSTWAEGSCQPERFLTAGNKVVVFVNVRVRLKNKSEWNEGQVVDVFTFQNAKVVEFRSFAEAKSALEWAGVKDL